jgi:hypothetical protein
MNRIITIAIVAAGIGLAPIAAGAQERVGDAALGALSGALVGVRSAWSLGASSALRQGPPLRGAGGYGTTTIAPAAQRAVKAAITGDVGRPET